MRQNRSEEEIKELIELYKEGKKKFNKYEELDEKRTSLYYPDYLISTISDGYNPQRRKEKEKKYKEEVERYEKKYSAINQEINKLKIEKFMKNWGQKIKIHLSFYEEFLFDTPSSDLKEYYFFEYQLSFLYKLLQVEISSPIHQTS